jgi:1-deoxy-D-xylulose-5-phosphate reductoisomerase
MPCVFNAANEVAVELFLGRKIEFLDIYRAIENAMDNHKILAGDNFENIKFADKEARDFVYKNFGGK